MQFNGHLHMHTNRLKIVVAPRLRFFRWALGVRVFPSQQSSIQVSLLNCPALGGRSSDSLLFFSVGLVGFTLFS